MHPLIEDAKGAIGAWADESPRGLALAVAELCRRTLDAGGLPGGPEWARLRGSFDIVKGRGIAETIVGWDENCTTADVEVSDRQAYVKLGIVTWVVKFLARRLGMLPGSEPIADFSEWKKRLAAALDRYVDVPTK